MQQITSRPGPDQQANRGGAPRSQVILIVALLLFSVAGLISGFSTGALVKKISQAAPPTAGTNTMSSLKGPNTTTPKTTVKVIPLGCPQEAAGTSPMFQQSDGTTPYTVVAQAVDTTGDQPDRGIYCAQANQPIHAAGITFKLWIIKHVGNKILRFPNLDQLTQPIDGEAAGKNFPELQNKLQFDTSQIQQSNDQGQVTWHYKINPDLRDGTYTMVILVDWQGKTPNWIWRDLIINKQG